MKSIFTGTEQDLIECGFDWYFILSDFYGKHYYRIYKDKVKINYVVGRDVAFSSINIKTSKKIKMKKKYIQDLIDKNLVRWE